MSKLDRRDFLKTSMAAPLGIGLSGWLSLPVLGAFFKPSQVLPQDRCTKSFDEMTPKERGLAVALDVLAQLEAGLIGRHMSYINFDMKFPEGTKLHDVLRIDKCRVCAIGAGIVSLALVFGRGEVQNVVNTNREYRDELYNLSDDGINMSGVHELLQNIYPWPMYAVMEVAFEGWSLGKAPFHAARVLTDRFGRIDQELLTRADGFYRQHYDLVPSEHLKAIYENVRDHGGEFVL